MEADKPSIDLPTGYREIYALLGEFMVEFQFFCFAIRSGIAMIVDVEGQTQGKVASVLTTEMTAAPLLRAFTSAAHEMHTLDEFQTTVISKIYNQAMKLIERRNELLHATWLTLSREGTDVFGPSAGGSHSKHSKQGIKFTSIISEPNDLQSLIDKCKTLQRLIFQIASALMFKIDFDECFVLNPDGSVSLNVSESPERTSPKSPK